MRSWLQCFGVACVVAGFAIACSTTQKGVSLPPLPAWQAPTNPAPVVGSYVKAEAQRRFPGVPVHVSGGAYTRINRQWLGRYVDWTWQAGKAAGIEYRLGSFDCVQYSKLFDAVAGLAAAKAGVELALLQARIVVQGSPMRHELLGVCTDEGIFIVEPQPDAGPFRIWPLEKYPRQIISITFGDPNPP